jgi:inosose dehydratase
MQLTTGTTRREFVSSAGAGLLALSFPRAFLLAEEASGGTFKVGIQSYSLRAYSVDQALEHSRKFGLKYWESFRAHFPLASDPKVLEAYREKLRQTGIILYAYGVEPFTANTDENRRRFEFARALGIRVLTADPEPASFDPLDRLVEEYDVYVAIHNHGPGARYDKIADTLKALRNHHDRIGACVDTGHYLRSNEDPIEAVEAFGPRTYGVHLKDAKRLPDGRTQFTVLGKGDLDTVQLLRALKKVRFEHCLALEYEENPENPLSDIAACLQELDRALKSVQG